MALLEGQVDLFTPPRKHDPAVDTSTLLRARKKKFLPRPTGPVSRPDPGPLTNGRMVAIGASYLLALFGAIMIFGISLWEMTVWLPRCLEYQVDGIAYVRMLLVLIGFGYAIRWIILIHCGIMEFLDEVTRPLPDPPVWPLVSIVVPGYNEEKLVEAMILSALVIDYPNYEVLIVDDGSKDRMLEIAKRYEGEYEFGVVRALTKPNGGKWTAHNYGIQEARGEFILCSDADSILDVQCIKTAVRRILSDPQADAVAGYTRVVPRHNWLLLMQTLEYVVWSGAIRLPQGRYGAVSCIPGPLGLFRRSALEKVADTFGRLPKPLKPGVYDGAFENDTFAEDFDLTIALQMLGGKVLYEPLAACDTDCPVDMFDLMNQRYRWSRGSLQVLRKIAHRCRTTPAFRKPATLFWLGLSYVYDLVCFSLAFVVQLVLTLAVLGGLYGDIDWFLFYLGVAVGFKFIISIPYILIHRENLTLSLLTPFIDWYGTYILGGALIISMVDEVRNNKMKW